MVEALILNRLLTGLHDARAAFPDKRQCAGDHSLAALPNAQALERQDRFLSFYAGGDARPARTQHGRALDAGVHGQAGRRRKAGLRA